MKKKGLEYKAEFDQWAKENLITVISENIGGFVVNLSQAEQFIWAVSKDFYEGNGYFHPAWKRESEYIPMEDCDIVRDLIEMDEVLVQWLSSNDYDMYFCAEITPDSSKDPAKAKVKLMVYAGDFEGAVEDCTECYEDFGIGEPKFNLYCSEYNGFYEIPLNPYLENALREALLEVLKTREDAEEVCRRFGMKLPFSYTMGPYRQILRLEKSADGFDNYSYQVYNGKGESVWPRGTCSIDEARVLPIVFSGAKRNFEVEADEIVFKDVSTDRDFDIQICTEDKAED